MVNVQMKKQICFLARRKPVPCAVFVHGLNRSFDSAHSQAHRTQSFIANDLFQQT